jgi:hypothetical protein
MAISITALKIALEIMLNIMKPIIMKISIVAISITAVRNDINLKKYLL